MNDDDSICIKPSNRNSNLLTDCKRNIAVEDVVLLGFGAIIRNVPRLLEHKCVNQVTFHNVIMPKTRKGCQPDYILID